MKNASVTCQFLQGCPNPGWCKCQGCLKLFCLWHVRDLNEDGRCGDEAVFICVDCELLNLN